MKHSVFVVRRFKNRNGVFSWRVQGTDLGVPGHREPLRQRPLGEAVDEYMVAKAQAHGYGLISASQLGAGREITASYRLTYGATRALDASAQNPHEDCQDVGSHARRSHLRSGIQSTKLLASSTPGIPP